MLMKKYCKEEWYQRFFGLLKCSSSEVENSPSFFRQAENKPKGENLSSFEPPDPCGSAPLQRGASKRIVLVSDFINKIGGIETYLHDVQELLTAQGHEVVLRGGTLPKGIL